MVNVEIIFIQSKLQMTSKKSPGQNSDRQEFA